MPTIHGVNASPFVRKVRVLLAEKGIDYDLVPVIPINPSQEFKKISPLGKIPVYQDGDFTLPDSSCICAYLERIHPDPPLYPKQPKDYGRALFYEEYADTKLVEALIPAFAQRIVVAKIMKGTPDEALVRRQHEELVPSVLEWLESRAPDGDGIVGDRFSIADIALASPLVNWGHAGEAVDASRWPRLSTYLERVLARPSFKPLIDEEKAALAAL